MYWLNLSGRESLCLQSTLWIMMYLRACLENSFLDMEQARPFFYLMENKGDIGYQIEHDQE